MAALEDRSTVESPRPIRRCLLAGACLLGVLAAANELRSRFRAKSEFTAPFVTV